MLSKAVENINTVISDALTGMDASDIYAVDTCDDRSGWNEGQIKAGRKCNPGGFYRMRTGGCDCS